MSSDGPEYDDPRCPGCGKWPAFCTCPTLAAEYVPLYEAIKDSHTNTPPNPAPAWLERERGQWQAVINDWADAYAKLAREHEALKKIMNRKLKR